MTRPSSSSPAALPAETPAESPAVAADARPDAPPVLPPLAEQATRLAALGLPGLDPALLHDAAARLAPDAGPGALLAVRPDVVPASVLAPHLRLGEGAAAKEGFVVVDMTDVDAFAPIDGLVLPDAPVYAVAAPDRGDDLANWSPDEALPALTARGRTPMLLTEGIHWALQAPAVLARNRCYMTIGSRLRKPGTRGRTVLDARTPALWISNGTGRDGRERRGAPKVGWCWAGNRHTWLGFASGTDRVG